MSKLGVAYLLFIFFCVSRVRVHAGGIEHEPSEDSVFNRGLIAEKISYSSIARESKLYHSDVSVRRFENAVLGYVTPWNSAGYDYAKIFRSKFTHICPVWYQIRPDNKGKLTLTGGHDVDAGWMKDVRGHDGRGPKIVPRFIVEGFSPADLERLLSSKVATAQLVDMVTAEVSNRRFDGLVLEMYSSLGQLATKPPTRLALHAAITALAHSLSPQRAQLILVVPPQHALFDSASYASLSPSVAYFSLMTYDYSSAAHPGPNAPLPWVVQTAAAILSTAHEGSGEERHRPSPPSSLLVGINFYGNDYRLPHEGGSMVASQFLEVLDKQRPKFVWDTDAHEHVAKYKTKDGATHHLYYPSLKSVKDRLDAASELGCGIAIWDLGQGLPYFYDLL